MGERGRRSVRVILMVVVVEGMMVLWCIGIVLILLSW